MLKRNTILYLNISGELLGKWWSRRNDIKRTQTEIKKLFC
jgi:hypothetical protein